MLLINRLMPAFSFYFNQIHTAFGAGAGFV
jgi:hypothetical protein